MGWPFLTAGEARAQHAQILARLDRIDGGLKLQMTDQQQELDLLKQIDAATTKQADSLSRQSTALSSIANSNRTLSDDLDALIARLTGTVPADVLAALSSQANKSNALAAALDAQATALDAQAAFSVGLAVKGNVPGDVPPAPVGPPA